MSQYTKLRDAILADFSASEWLKYAVLHFERVKIMFEVIVGNIGTVYCGDDRLIATEEFRQYKALSQAQYGRCSGEPVDMFENGEHGEQEPGEGPGLPRWNEVGSKR